MIDDDEREARLERYSFSRAATYLMCPKMHDFRYVQKLLPIRDNPYLTRGQLIHIGLENATKAHYQQYRGVDVIHAADAAILDKHKEQLNEPLLAALIDENPDIEDEFVQLMQLCQNIVKRVILAHGLDGDRWETIEYKGEPLIEYDFEVMFDGLAIHHKIDWVVYDNETKLVYEADFKTRKQFLKHEDDEYNAQHPMYMHALREHGIDVDGSMTWQIKAAEPKKPVMNKTVKKGVRSMSRTAIATDWKTYHAALIEEGLDPNDYLAMRDKLSSFEQLDQTLRTNEECANIWSEYALLLSLLRDITQGAVFLPTPRALNPRTCKGCEYADLCMEQVRGHDIPESEYKLFGLSTRKQREEMRAKKND